MAGLLFRLILVGLISGPIVAAILTPTNPALVPAFVALLLLGVAFASGAIEKWTEAIGFALIVDFGLTASLLAMELPGVRQQVGTLDYLLPPSVGLALGLFATVGPVQASGTPVVAPTGTNNTLMTEASERQARGIRRVTISALHGTRRVTISALQRVLQNRFAFLLLNVFVSAGTAVFIALFVSQPEFGKQVSTNVSTTVANTTPILSAGVVVLWEFVVSIVFSVVAVVFGTLFGSIITRNVLKRAFREFRDAIKAWLLVRRNLLVAFTLGYFSVVIVFFGIYAAAFKLDPGEAFRRVDENGHLVKIDQNATHPVPYPELLYFSMNSIAPLGYSEVRPYSPTVRTFAFLELTLGIGWTVVIFAALASTDTSDTTAVSNSSGALKDEASMAAR